jgi:hypothetical protein
MGHSGLEPETRGLKVRCSAIELVALLAAHRRQDSNLQPFDS